MIDYSNIKLAQKNGEYLFLADYVSIKSTFVSPTPLSDLGVAGTGGYQWGMDQTEIDEKYANTPLQGKVTAPARGWQQYTVPTTGTYKITIQGADGGSAGTQANKALVKGGRGARLEFDCDLVAGDILLALVGNTGFCNDASDYGSGGGGASALFVVKDTGQYTASAITKKVDLIAIAGGGAGRWDENHDTVNDVSVDDCPLNAKFTDGENTNDGVDPWGTGPYSGLGLASILAKKGTANTSDTTYGGFPGGGQSYNGGGGGAGYSGGNMSDSQPSYGGTSFVNTTYCKNIKRSLRPYQVEPAQNGFIAFK